MGYVTREQIRRARRADLYGYLLAHHSSSVRKEGVYLRLKGHDSIVIRIGSSGYTRYSNAGETGNPIDFLVRYMGYSFTDAVSALAGGSGSIPQAILPLGVTESCGPPVAFPQMGGSPFKRVYSYLTQTRCQDPRVVNALIHMGLLYQDEPFGNAVFINHEHTYCEVRGTLSGVRFHRSVRALTDAAWWFRSGQGTIQAAYVCEGAIDAVSLYELMAMDGSLHDPAIYYSIGGVGNKRALEAIGNKWTNQLILAVDNDMAGDICRQANSHFRCIIPEGKDWNEDLCRRKTRMR